MDAKPKNTRSKNDAPQRISNVLFVMLWMAGHAVALVLAAGIYQLMITLRVYIEVFLVRAIVAAAGTGFLTAIVQLLLVERGLKKQMRGWLPVSVAAWAIGGIVMYWTLAHFIEFLSLMPEEWISPIGELWQRLFPLPLFLPVALLQWTFLRRKVKSASLWILSSVVGAIMAMLIQQLAAGSPSPYVMLALAALLYSAPTGATMLYLWTQSDEKAKNVASQAQIADLNDAERVARLSDESRDHQTGLSEPGASASAAQAGL